MRNPEDFLLIHGCGGHARSVADVAIAAGTSKLVFIDEGAKAGENIFGFEVIPAFRAEDFQGWKHIVAIGDTTRRIAIFAELTRLGCKFANVTAPDATIGLGARLGQGIFIGRGAHIGPLASIGDNSIINTHAVVDHESTVGGHSHIAVNATVAGRCAIGDQVFIGAGATVIDGIGICAGTIIGAGAVVVKDIDTAGAYMGIPAARVALARKKGSKK